MNLINFPSVLMVPLIRSLLQLNPHKLEFPEELCTIQNEREPNVYDSEVQYICMVCMDQSMVPYNVTSSCSFRILKPYIAYPSENGDDNVIYYGWIDDGGVFYDHIDHDIHNDNERVVLWMQICNHV
jgi:hypothetical protein